MGRRDGVGCHPGSVSACLGKQVKYRHATDYQPHADEGPCVKLLSVEDPRDCGDQHDAKP